MIVRRIGVGVTAAVLALALMTSPAVLPDTAMTTTGLAPVLPEANAAPKPGEPGGNSSKPGDNDKKKDDNDRDSDSGSSDSDSSSSRSSTESSSDADSGHKSQTEHNNRWTPDGTDRSVNTRVTRDSSPPQAPQQSTQPTQEPAATDEPDPAEQPELATDTSPRTPLQDESLKRYRGPTAVRQVPSQKTRAKLQDDVERFEQGDPGGKYFNRDPFNEGTFDPDARPEADHLIPVEQVVRMPRFAELSWEDQEAILDSDINIVPATPSENRSRKNRLFTDYSIRSRDGRPLDEAYRQMRIEQTQIAYQELQRQIDERCAAGSRRPGLPPASNGPVEMPVQDPPVEVPANQQPPEMPVVSAPPEVPPVQVREVPPTPPLVEVSGNPVPPVSNYPLPPVRPAQPPGLTDPVGPTIGVPVAPKGTAVPPIPGGTAPPTIGVPATVVPTFSTPPQGPVAIPNTADPLATLRHEFNALDIEYNTIADRLFALHNTGMFDTRPADIAEYQSLQGLSALVSSRRAEISYLLANPPEQLRPPPSTLKKTVEAIGTGLATFGTGLATVLSFAARPFASLGR